MNAELHEIFPIPIVRYLNVLTDQQLEDIFNFILQQKDSMKYSSAFTEKATSSFGQRPSILFLLQKNLPSCNQIISIVEEKINHYASEIMNLNLNRIGLNNSWCNIQQKESILKMHIHGSALFSGALYIHTDLNSSKLVFQDFLNHKILLKEHLDHIRHPNAFNSEVYSLSPNPGDLIIFPGLLMHGSLYEKNQTENRMIIGFNVN